MRTLLFLLCCLCSSLTKAQIFPVEGGKLHYRIVPFVFPGKDTSYKIEIAEGHFNNEDSFKRNVIKTGRLHKNRVIEEVPSFGREYTWQVSAGKGKPGPMHHFATITSSFVDSNVIRLSVDSKSAKYKDYYIFADGSRSLYDMDGHPVWFLPNCNGLIRDNASLRDINCSPQNTITLMYDGEANEISYNADVLWSAPNGRHEIKSDSVEGYHHEITRLSNGHYMLLAFESVSKKVRDSIQAKRSKPDSTGKKPHIQRKVRSGTIVEYDEEGKLVWEWNSARYLATIDSNLLKKPTVRPQGDAHSNSFFFDEKNKCVYLSFRNLSQIIRIAYPSGEVLNVYGRTSDLSGQYWDTLLCGQHSCKVSEDGHLYYFDNGCEIESLPKVVMLKQPLTEEDTLKVLWQFICPVVYPKLDMAKLPGRMKPFTTGGNALELPGHDMFISTCNPSADIFIVDKQKEILWHAALEKFNPGQNIWHPLGLYRANIITRQQLESLIWQGVSAQ